jgi:hypothetical protein
MSRQVGLGPSINGPVMFPHFSTDHGLYEVRVLDAQCTPAGLDPAGTVSTGYVKVVGFSSRVFLSVNDEQGRLKIPIQADQRGSESGCMFSPDARLPEERIYNRAGDGLPCTPARRLLHGVVAVKWFPDAYRRLGMVKREWQETYRREMFIDRHKLFAVREWFRIARVRTFKIV